MAGFFIGVTALITATALASQSLGMRTSPTVSVRHLPCGEINDGAIRPRQPGAAQILPNLVQRSECEAFCQIPRWCRLEHSALFGFGRRPSSPNSAFQLFPSAVITRPQQETSPNHTKDAYCELLRKADPRS